jgi:hypothetical protein
MSLKSSSYLQIQSGSGSRDHRFAQNGVTNPEEVQRHLDHHVGRVSGTDAFAIPFLGHPLPRGPRVKFRGEESAKTPGFAQPDPTTKREGPTQLGLRGIAWRELGS